ncbi:MAG: hypothetical protein MK137_08545 [Rickettsiales bacterium]|nr:hypothetical protein [Rickettsiales bacterium]
MTASYNIIAASCINDIGTFVTIEGVIAAISIDGIITSSAFNNIIT